MEFTARSGAEKLQALYAIETAKLGNLMAMLLN
jgi:hypothetical protein